MVCITGENEQPFRSMANGNFGRSRTPISDEAERSFRLMPNTHFDTAELTLSVSIGCFWSEPRQSAPTLAVMQSSRWG